MAFPPGFKMSVAGGLLLYFVLNLFSMDIHGKICDVYMETVRGDGHHGQRSLSEDFIHAHTWGIMDDVMKDLHFTTVGCMQCMFYIHWDCKMSASPYQSTDILYLFK
uniref:CEP76 N-terminal domain-containing protein n=1 Tax=Cyprinus carpio TaxID=7962 RepID=A0A8C2J5W5_CYPCA